MPAGSTRCFSWLWAWHTPHPFMHTRSQPDAPSDARAMRPPGAGDLFAAGFLAALVAGRPLRNCARLGCLAGAAVLQARPPSGTPPRLLLPALSMSAPGCTQWRMECNRSMCEGADHALTKATTLRKRALFQQSCTDFAAARGCTSGSMNAVLPSCRRQSPTFSFSLRRQAAER